MADQYKYDVYLCHAPRDVKSATLVERDLSSKGITVWFSRLVRSGEIVSESRRRAFALSKLVVVLIGEDGLEQLDEEVKLMATRKAANADFKIIPLKLAGHKKQGIPRFIDQVHALQFSPDVPEDVVLDELSSDIKHYLSEVAEKEHSRLEDLEPNSSSIDTSINVSDNPLNLRQLLELPKFKRLRPDEQSALILAGGYCLRRAEQLSSFLLMGAILTSKTRSAIGKTEDAFLNAIEKQLKEKGRFSTTGNFLNLPADFAEFCKSAKERDVPQEEVILTRELVTTLEIAAAITKERKNNSIHTRHVLGAILSRGHQAVLASSPESQSQSALGRLKQLDIDVDRLRRDFMTYLRKERDTDDVGEGYLTWLKYISVEPPEALLTMLISGDLIVVLKATSESEADAIDKAQLYIQEQGIPPRELLFLLLAEEVSEQPSQKFLMVRAIFVNSLIGEPVFPMNSLREKIVLEFPVGSPSVSETLKNIGLIEEDFQLRTVYEAGNKGRQISRSIWRSILILNPEHVDTLENLLSKTIPLPTVERESAIQAPTIQGPKSEVENATPAKKSRKQSLRKANSPPPTQPTQRSVDILEADPEDISSQDQQFSQNEAESDRHEPSSSESSPVKPVTPQASANGEDSQGPGPIPESVYQTGPGQPFISPIIKYITREIPQPTPAKNRVSIHLVGKGVVLWYQGQPYESPNNIPENLTPKTTPPEEYGVELFKGIIHGNHKNSSLAGYEKAKKASQQLTFELWISQENSALNAHRFEYLCDPVDKALPLSTREKIPFYRRVHSTQIKPIKAKPLKILAAICNPLTLGTNENKNLASLVKLDALQEISILKAAFSRLATAGLASYDILGAKGEAVTLEAIAAKLEEGFHVLHLLGHGVVINNSYSLVMEDKDRRHKFESAERLQKTLKAQDLRLVVLAACQSATKGTGVSLQGLGPSIVGDEIPAVIAMQDEVNVATAQLFTQHFYDDLARTGCVDMAMSATRRALFMTAPHEWQWGIPVLFMSTDDGDLFDVDQKSAQALAPLEPDIKSYDQLGGLGDPSTRKAAQAIESEARSHGVSEEVLNTLRAVLAPSLLNPRPSAETLAKPQDREALTKALPNLVALDPEALETFVRTTGTKLEVDKPVYRQIASALNAGKHIILNGPPGTGKTSLAHAICRYAETLQCANGFIPTTATADWTAFDTIGGYVPTAQQVLQFRPGKFLDAVCSGSWLVIDEINRSEIDKAFGELFTVLSGQRADLPYTVGQDQVRILPASNNNPIDWIPNKGVGLSGYDYVVHPTWRIIATMNVYDKSSLFGMSFAFMRRFAFVDVDLPQLKTFEDLLERWATEQKLDLKDKDVEQLLAKFLDLLKPGNPLSCRALGPAIVKDMMCYLGDRLRISGNGHIDLLGEAFLLYVTPQLDGLDRTAITAIYGHLKNNVFPDVASCESLLRRLRSLYPHISTGEWEGRPTS